MRTLFFPYYHTPMGFNEVFPPTDIIKPYEFEKDVIIKGYTISVSTFSDTHVQAVLSKKFLDWKEVVPPNTEIDKDNVFGGLNSHGADNITVMFDNNLILLEKGKKDALHIKVWAHNMDILSLFGLKRDFHMFVIIYYEEL